MQKLCGLTILLAAKLTTFLTVLAVPSSDVTAP